MNLNQIQQGDVLLIRITELPKNVKKTANRIVAHGESGHTHILTGNVQMYECNNDNDLFFEVLGNDVELKHEEHNVVTSDILSPGFYKVGRIVEYDYETEEAKYVKD